MLLDLAQSLWRVVEKSRRIRPFSPFRAWSVVNRHSMGECCFFFPFDWLSPLFTDHWRYSWCLVEGCMCCGGVVTDDGAMVRFLVVFALFSIWLYDAISLLFLSVKGIIRCRIEWEMSWRQWAGMEVAYRFRGGFFCCVGTFSFMGFSIFSTHFDCF